MVHNIIAFIFDCDGTLCPDTTNLLLDEVRISKAKFWNTVVRMVSKGWDPPLAYMSLLCSINENEKRHVTRETFETVGSKIQFFPGIPKVFLGLQKFADSIPQLREAGIKVEYYIITGGIEDIIKASVIRNEVNGIFGCRFITDKNGEISAPMSVISFTEKTRYVFAINKGISESEMRRSPYTVNDAILDQDRRVSFENMIYVGDGPSDVPCFSLIAKFGGKAIGVYKSSSRDSSYKGYELARGKRIGLGPYQADYRTGTDLRQNMENCIREIGFDIVTDVQNRKKKAPSF